MFEFVWPWVLILLPLPFLVKSLLPAKKSQPSYALKIPFYSHIQALSYQEQKQNPVRSLLIWLMWIALIIALCGPQWVGEPVPIKREGRNILLALDISGSMQQGDIKINQRPVTRLTVVKNAAEDFIKQRKTDRLGLILFGTHAYLQTPLTFDHKTVLHMLDDASVGLAGQTTSIGDAIALSVKRLRKTPGKSRVLILLTDGANNTGNIEQIPAAEIAKQNHIKIYTIGLGADEATISTIYGNQTYYPSQDLDEKTLKKISSLTGGEYYRARDFEQLKKIYANINKLESVQSKAEIYRPIEVYYYFPLGLAFICLLAMGLPRRKAYV